MTYLGSAHKYRCDWCGKSATSDDCCWPGFWHRIQIDRADKSGMHVPDDHHELDVCDKCWPTLVSTWPVPMRKAAKERGT